MALNPSGRWHQLTGNQLGILLASHVISTYPPHRSLSKVAMLNSAVSTGMLAAIAAKEGFHFDETLTGFKWLGNKTLELRDKGYDACFAFEESIGYMFPAVIPDKDSISAAAVFITAMSRWRAREDLTPWGKLQDLYRTYGFFQEANTYLISPKPELTKEIFNVIRHTTIPHPAMLGRRRILRWRDLTEGYDSATGGLPALPVSKDSQMITCELEGRVKLTARGSGTEPKIKQCQADSLVEARRGADDVLEDLKEEWFKPDANGLVTE
ncbi:hypothetical protein GP486_000209 [Trichoglossum hirsutum]|uniref:Alpha-D-phosphohexomutase alpha/beta/alpha domain-containing protein n=1 Tax=Trichoglossum hirsutum TaxID=265104 RepID=A0A9P8RU47_9PEZI|nr:hypothetical protein GP486_000209 [Trichoglossum hirsutum]